MGNQGSTRQRAQGSEVTSPFLANPLPLSEVDQSVFVALSAYYRLWLVSNDHSSRFHYGLTR